MTQTRYWPVLRSAGGTDIASHSGPVPHGTLKLHEREYTEREAEQVCDWMNGNDQPLVPVGAQVRDRVI